MWFGGDYNPEQWPEETWLDDVRRMQEAGVTLVTVGVFAWARLEPSEGHYDFEWLDRVLDLLHQHGIAVDLATATASPPPWATLAYPGIVARNAEGAPYWHGSRQHYSPTSPDYRRLAERLTGAIVDRYADHPAVALWHVNNEYACHLHHDYSDNAAVAFRAWLRSRYGSIDELNGAWGTAFWSQRYGSFEEIVPPRLMPYSDNPGRALDFRRFTSDALLELFLAERDIIRRSGSDAPVTTNFMGAFPVVDYRAWAPHLDVVSDDSYPDPNDPEAFRAAAFTRDLMRSLKPGTPWLLMEQAANAVNWRPANAPKAPGQMAALSMQAVGRGADGVLYFQWRQSVRGSERFHSAMLPHAGTGTRTWREVVALGDELARLPALGTDAHARVALVFDWENWWALSGTDHPFTVGYNDVVQRWYAALHRRHVAVDVVGPCDPLDPYAVVVLAQQYLLTEEHAARLTAFVEGGGHLLVGAFSDVVDEHDGFRPGGFTTLLGDLLGLRLLDFGALVPPAPRPFAPAEPDGVAQRIAAGADAPGLSSITVELPAGRITGQYLAEELEVRDADVVGQYVDGRAPGAAALTARRQGQGVAMYLGTIPDDPGMDVLVEHLLREAGVPPLLPGLPDTVEVARRGDVLTVINHATEPVVLRLAATDALTGATLPEVPLEPFGFRLLRMAEPDGPDPLMERT